MRTCIWAAVRARMRRRLTRFHLCVWGSASSAQRAAWLRGGHPSECAALAALWASQRRTPPPSLRLLHRILLKRHAQTTAAASSSAPAPPPWDAPCLLSSLVSHRAHADAEALLSAAQMATLLASYAGTAVSTRLDDNTDAFDANDDADEDASPSASAPAPPPPPPPPPPATASESWRIPIDVEGTTALLLALSCNAHSVADAELRPIGRALYPLIAVVNHDCAPNAALTFRAPGFIGQLRVLDSELNAGTEVTIAYVDVCATAEERKAALRCGYFFECGCARCAAAAARGGSEEDRALVRVRLHVCISACVRVWWC
jgi:hypothetical protein